MSFTPSIYFPTSILAENDISKTKTAIWIFLWLIRIQYMKYKLKIVQFSAKAIDCSYKII